MRSRAGCAASISIRWRRGSGWAPGSARSAASSRCPIGGSRVGAPRRSGRRSRAAAQRPNEQRLLYALPLVMLLIMAGFFGWSLLSGRDPESIGSALVAIRRRASWPRPCAPASRRCPRIFCAAASRCWSISSPAGALPPGRASAADAAQGARWHRDRGRRLEEQARRGARLAGAAGRPVQGRGLRSRRQAGLDWASPGSPRLS